MRIRIATSLLATAAFAGSAHASIVSYREIFCHSGTDAPSFSNGQPTSGSAGHIGWYLRRPNLVGHITASAGGTPIHTVAAGIGKPADLPAVNAGPQQSSQTQKGFAVIPGATAQTADAVPNGSAYLLYTRERSVALAGIERATWYQGNHSATDVWRLAIEVDGGQWFVSDQTFTNAPVTSGGAFPTAGEFKSVDWGSALWRNLDFNGDLAASSGSMAVGTLATPSGSNVTGFGLYSDSKNGNMRFDTFQIDSVPEPASLAALGLGAAGLLRRRSRR